MKKATYNDLVILHQYVDVITTFIQSIVGNEDVAVLLACEVFIMHGKRQTKVPFENEASRTKWLYAAARILANNHIDPLLCTHSKTPY